jgi:NTP pyrophosphatase (non-canonical NTP hydrolase)
MCTLIECFVKNITYRYCVQHAIKLKQRKRRMNLREYQELAARLALPTALNHQYLSLGLVGEAGEVASLFAKAVRDSEGLVNRDSLKKELGDVLWFVAVLAEFYNMDMQDVAVANINKLRSRQERGKLQGSGDER